MNKRRIGLLVRVIPLLVIAAGVILLAAGVLPYVSPAFGEWRTPGRATDPAAQPSGIAARAVPTVVADRPPTVIDVPSGSAASARPSPAGAASRIRIPALGIDLPVVPADLDVPGNVSFYPLCDVAMYMTEFAQPGQPGTTYLYAHAQEGMFLPLLRASAVDDGAVLVGTAVEVYTTDDLLHVYEITRVKRHATDLSIVSEAGDAEQLVLQTSEGPTGTLPKLQVAARPVSTIRATPQDAQPSPNPRVCSPDPRSSRSAGSTEGPAP